MMKRWRSQWLFMGMLLSWRAVVVTAAEPTMVLSGDGLTVVVHEYDEEAGQVNGELRYGAGAYAFQGRMRENDDGTVVTGQYVADGQTFSFTARSVGDTEDMIFTTGQKTFHLRPVQEIPGQAPPTRRSPLEEPAEAESPLSVPPVERSEGKRAPAQSRPASSPADRAGSGADAPGGDSTLPKVMKMKRHAFRDVTMGGIESHVVLLPEGWTAEGRVEWSAGDVPHPQQMFRLVSPEKGRFATVAAYHNMYTVMNNVAGFDPIPPQGVPPPEHLPQWVVSFFGQTGRVANVKLVKARRDPATEAALNRMQAETNANDAGMEREAWIVLIDYDEAGARRREEIRLLYVRYAPIVNQNLSSRMWSVFPSSMVSAPADRFEKLSPQLYAVGATIRPTPRWWIASQSLLAELSRARIADAAERIRQRARESERLSDAQMAQFRKDMAAMDVRQKGAIDTIYERQDYRDTDGGYVNLSIHHKHVFSDGQGNYVMSNSIHDKPGEMWQEIKPAK